jgi:hypothetical protein
MKTGHRWWISVETLQVVHSTGNLYATHTARHPDTLDHSRGEDAPFAAQGSTLRPAPIPGQLTGETPLQNPLKINGFASYYKALLTGQVLAQSHLSIILYTQRENINIVLRLELFAHTRWPLWLAGEPAETNRP